MTHVRSRKFCCCLPVRFGIICESLLGLGLGGFIAIGGWIQVNALLKGDLTLEQNQKVAIWFVAISMSIFALTSLLGLIGSIGKLRSLVGIYFGTITAVTVLDIIGGCYLIFQLFNAETDEKIKECEDRIQGGANDVSSWACQASFKTGRVIVVVLYVIFWLIAIYGCVIAYDYFAQLGEEDEARINDAEKSQASNVTIVTQPQYAFTSQPNAYSAPQY